MNIKQIEKAVPALLKNNIVPLFWGSQGTGKTTLVKKLGKELGYDSVIHLCLSTQEVGDLVGVLLEQPDGTAKHTRPNWFPERGKHLLFLDEINRTHPDVIQAVFTLILEGKIHQHVLPKGCAIIAAANYANNNFNTTDISDNAFMSRFAHIDFKPTVEEFCSYADSQGAESVADFIRAYPAMLEASSADNKFDFNVITPDRRAWNDFIAPLEKHPELDDVRYELYSGIVGSSAAASFLTWKNQQEATISGKNVILNYKKYQKKVLEIVNADVKDVRLDVLNQTVEGLFAYLDENCVKNKEMLTNEQIENIKQFIKDIPLELGLKMIKQMGKSRWTQRDDIISNPEFVEAFLSHKKVGNKDGKK